MTIILCGARVVFAVCNHIDSFADEPKNNIAAIENANTKKNAVLITISSLRADHVSGMGYGRHTTPHYDNFCKENYFFTHAFATSSWQMPSVGSIFTSLYPSDHGATHINRKLNFDAYTLADVFNENGYVTVGFSCNPRLSADFGFNKGYDYYDDYSVEMLLSNLSLSTEETVDINKCRTNDLVNDSVIRWLKNNTHYPFFLFVHYYDNHWDYRPQPPYDTLFDPDYQGDLDGSEVSKEPLYSNKPSDRDLEHLIALYDGQIRQTDQDLNVLLDFLSQDSRFNDTIIIIMADHGEQFYEHGHTSHHGIYDELIHVPLAISVPGSTTSRSISELVSGVDIMPTLCDLVGIPIPTQCKGRSLKPLMEGKSDSENHFIFAEYSGGAVPDCYAVRFKQYKFVCENNEIFAFDIIVDPVEQKKIFRNVFSVELNDMFKIANPLLTRPNTVLIK